MLATKSFLKNIPSPNYDRPGDGFYESDASTVLLIRSNTTNGSTVFTDLSDNTLSITGSGGISHNTGAFKLGSSSLFFDGSNDVINIADHADFDVGTGDFTIDFWQKASTASGNANWISRRTSSTTSQWYFRIENSTALTFALPVTSGGHDQQQFNFTVGTSNWHHMAIVRSSGSTKTYANGTQIWVSSASYNMNTHSGDAGTTVHLGARLYNNAQTQFFHGYMDEIRFSNVARWTSSFTVY